MQKQGKFLLFANAGEFAAWLDTITVTRRIALVQNHHTWMPNYSTFKGTNHFQMLQGMEAGHIERGFAEIAQNLTTYPDGSIAVCRDMDKIPAGIKGANTGGICIEHVGNFDTGGDTMSDVHRDAIVQLNAILCHRFQLTPSTNSIVYHHWYDLNSGVRTNGTGVTKTCPGSNFFGGNTVEAAAANFVPLVAQALGALGPAPAAKPDSQGGFIVTATSLNVRSDADAGAKVVKTLAKGVHVDTFETKGDWSRIHPTDQQWVSNRFLAPLAAANSAVAG